MKRTILLVSAITCSTSLLQLNGAQETRATSFGTTIQVKTPNTAAPSIKPGDMLNLSDFTKMPSGIMYKIIKKGSGEKAVNGENLTVHYTGWLLLEGKKVGLKFDSSLDRNQPFTFKLGTGQVIPGWEISLADMKVGENRIVIIPSNKAYGSRALASIPADSTLIFEITLIFKAS